MDKKFPSKPIELHARPTDVDLENFIDAAEEGRNTRFSYVWKSTHGEEFMISLHFVNETQIEWRMFSGSEENAKELWVLVTDDATDIYTMIIKSSGEDLEKAVKSDLKRTRELLRGPSPSEQRDAFDGTKKMMAGEIERLRKTQQSALAGELSLVHITNVMQSISMAKMSGRLSIDAKESQVDMFFLNGAPVHATGTMGDGKECLLRAVGLEEGRFHFDAEARTDQRTINEPLDSVILQGAKLVDDTRYLTDMGLVNESILVRTNAMISEKQFEELVSSGEPADMGLLKSVYVNIDDQSSVKEIVRRVGLSRMYWLDALAKLIRCKAIYIKATESPDGEVLKPKVLSSDIKSVITQTMINDDTGLFHYPAFLYLLGHEANRSDGEHPLSIILFELLGDNKTSLPRAVLEGIIWLINEIKRPVDIVGHYEEQGFALIMPDTKAQTAATFAERIAESVNSDPLIRSVEIRNVKMAFGVATLPGDVDDMYSLLAAAEMARDYSYNNGSPVVMAQNLAPQN